MSVWAKVEGVGGLISGVAAFIVAGVAIYQASTANQKTDELIENYNKTFFAKNSGFNKLFLTPVREEKVLTLMNSFERVNWAPMTVAELWEAEEAAELGVSKQEFIQIIRAGFGMGVLREVFPRSGEKIERTAIGKIEWRPVFRIN
ncbi:MAG: hypothetical protein K5905_00180 [Roseibium sp.]|uniref:hypothetical protein n=1 Tax=Roseibium sp. TaxID=1936156 RepID=UPI002620D5C8|nr:hypothetical protein [Roseibium sp.]MCV0423866.1 hypothetical protein [Roseibium sp.]